MGGFIFSEDLPVRPPTRQKKSYLCLGIALAYFEFIVVWFLILAA
jgi:hypothetical protein